MTKNRVWVLAGIVTFGSAALIAQPPAGQGGRGRGGIQIREGEECPPGTTEFRHLQCRAPQNPPPSIVDYRPRSTVVADAHLVPKAKYPVADIHTHNTAAFAAIRSASRKWTR
jgi:hypothetical protein